MPKLPPSDAKPSRKPVKPTPAATPPRRPGALKGRIIVPDDFDTAESETIAQLFEGEED